jgi:phosphatidylserine/phosphatidylglycerophosphate/cardiolipin synthase-like enzyme
MFKTRLKQVGVALLALVLVIGTSFGIGYWKGYTTPRSDVDPQDYIVTVFTPYEDGIGKYLEFLDQTKHSLHGACYSFTDARITDKIIELKHRGVNDMGFLVDKTQSVARSGKYQQAQINRLRAEGIEVVVGTSEKKSQIMHLKFTERDGEEVEDGSWNCTVSANLQDNNLNFIKSKKRAALYLSNWQRMHDFMKKQDQTPWDKDD